ncbi:MAG TPA: formamidopyrimidine-DNA glycosylase [Bacteroidetes bacterium]|nr:MAG: formamidopyrimidine-DNA glycosylase [Ignavibacteria bacterium GWA2_54_16]HCA78726.1 formamidopyrimidine-DNA glycosylase [Bacteroidota bacterium]
MPELPDITLYIESLQERIAGQRLEKIRLGSPFILRSVDPPIDHVFGRSVVRIRRMGKRIVFQLEGDFYIVIHLMIAGRFHWKKPNAKLPGRISHAAFDFRSGTLLLTEASSKKRASMHIVRGASALAQFDRGGLEVLDASEQSFKNSLIRENRTLKRALTDPTIFSGIGNSYSDEILHHARLSPLKLSRKLSDEEVARLFESTITILRLWTERLRVELEGEFPEKVTAFRDEMAVHGRFGKPCPVCGTTVQRIVYAENECNYCPRCQTGGRLLSDRSLARLLKDDWPKTVDELEQGGAGKGRA